MKEKLIRDYKQPQNLSNTNRCLITSSHFGRMSNGIDYDMYPALQTIIKNENIEEVFQRSKANGLISSAAWDLVAIPEFFSNVEEKINYPVAILRKIQELLPLSHGDYAPRANKMIQGSIEGKACDNNFWEFSRFLSVKEDVNALPIKKHNCQHRREGQKSQLLKSNKSSDASVDIAKCVEDYDQAFGQYIAAMSDDQTISVKKSLNFFNTYENSPQFKECASIIKDKEAFDISNVPGHLETMENLKSFLKMIAQASRKSKTILLTSVTPLVDEPSLAAKKDWYYYYSDLSRYISYLNKLEAIEKKEKDIMTSLKNALNRIKA